MVITDLHFYEPAKGHGLKHDPFNAIIAPRPIGWISSRGASGNINLAPYSYFNAVAASPPILAFSSNSGHHIMVITDLHFYEPAKGHGLKHDPFNAIIAPRPIGWISSRGASGNINLAPYSYFNAVAASPPILAFSSNSWKDTVRNVRETGEFVWNLATMPLARQMNLSSAHVPPDVSEFDTAGLTPVPSSKVSVPRVGESPAVMECKLVEIIQLKTKEGRQMQTWVTFGEVVAVHLDKARIKDGVYQTALAQPIARAGRRGDYFEITADKQFDMPRPD